jgi:uncharacterized coiled-coil DUF342 family protein
MGDEAGVKTPIQKPDKVALNNRLNELDIELKKQQTRREQLIARIANVKVAFDESNARIAEDRLKFNALREEHQQLKRQRETIIRERDQAKEAAEKASKEAREFFKRINFKSVEEIDRRINALEMRLSTENLGLKGEKELINEVSTLRNQKVLLAKAVSLQAVSESNRENNKESSKGMNEKYTEVTSKLKAVGDKMNAAYENLQQHLKARDDAKGATASTSTSASAPGTSSSGGGMKSLYEERDAVYESIKRTNDEIRKLKDDFFTADKAYRAYEQMQSRLLYEASLKEKKEAEAAASSSDSAAASSSSAPQSSAGAAASSSHPSTSLPASFVHPWAAEIELCTL